MEIRRAVFNLYLYTGLAAGLFLVLSGLTGSIIVFREEIEDLLHPELTEMAACDERVSLQAVLDAVRQAYPQDRLLALRMPRTPQQAYLLKMNEAHGLFVYADPRSGKLLGAHRRENTFMGWLALLHAESLLGEGGKTIQGIIALLLICISAAVLWRPLNGKTSRVIHVDWSITWKETFLDFRHARGIYTAVFLLIVFTGISLVFNKTMAGFTNSVTTGPSKPASFPSDPPAAAEAMLSLDELLRQADRILPAPTTWISFPQTPQAPLVVRKKLPEESHRNGRSFIYFDQHTGKVLLIENASTSPPGTWIYNTFYPVHAGVIEGVPIFILQGIAGFASVALFVAGYILWRSRKDAEAYKKIAP